MKNKRKLNLGVSVPIGFLSGDIDTAEDRIFSEQFNSIEAFIDTILKNDVNSIEVRYISSNTPVLKTIKAVENALKTGLKISIHGYLPELNSDEKKFENLASILNILERDKHSSVITVHPLKSKIESLNKTIDKNVEVLKSVLEKYFNNNYLKLALEINRAVGQSDPSYTYRDLLLVCRKVNHPALGFCWDFGHSYWNVLNNKLDIIAPDDFINLVFHTHIHDLSKEGQTHWPLNQNNLPIKNYMRQLITRNYDGIYNLELIADRWIKNFNLQEELFKSLKKLKNF